MEIKNLTKPEEVIDPNFHPAPTMKIHFADGQVIQMNRRDRRRNHLYRDRLSVVKAPDRKKRS